MSGTQVSIFRTGGGLQLVGDVGGNGGAPTIVLLHGGGQTRHAWDGAGARLVGDGYRVVNYDARGHGESDWAADGNYAIAAFAADLLDVLATLPRPLALVGASLGGMTAIHAAGESDAAIADALVLVDIAPQPNRAGADRIVAFMRDHANGFASLHEASDAIAAFSGKPARAGGGSGLARNLRRKADGRFHWHWDPRLLDVPPGSHADPSAKDTWALAAKVDRPTLLVRGGRSEVVDDASVEALVGLMPHVVVSEVVAAGHTIAGDDNDAFHALTLDFLRQHLPLC